MYEITVLAIPGNRSATSILNVKMETYPVTLRITLYGCIYTVWCIMENVFLPCVQFFEYENARIYTHRAMKLVMQGRFVYNMCSLCRGKTYYPEYMCTKSQACIARNKFFSTPRWFVEKQIEKIPKHTSDMTRHEQDLETARYRRFFKSTEKSQKL